VLRKFLVLLPIYFFTIALFNVNVAFAQFTQEEEKQKTNSTTYQRSKLTIAPPVSLIEQQENDLEHFLSKSEINKLLAGPDDFITLIKTNTTSNNKGVVLFLPDWSQSATSSKAINFLRNTLPDHGWTTLSIHPQKKPDNYPSIAENHTERMEENKKSLQEYKAKLTKVMISVMDTVQNYPGIFIMVAEGENSAILIDLYQRSQQEQNQQQEKTPLPSAVILLSAHMFTIEDNTIFADNLANSEFPVLDLFLRLDHPQAIYNAKLRQNVANKKMKVFYRQRQLINSSTGYYPQQQLLTEINGWLKSIGW